MALGLSFLEVLNVQVARRRRRPAAPFFYCADSAIVRSLQKHSDQAARQWKARLSSHRSTSTRSRRGDRAIYRREHGWQKNKEGWACSMTRYIFGRYGWMQARHEDTIDAGSARQ